MALTKNTSVGVARMMISPHDFGWPASVSGRSSATRRPIICGIRSTVRIPACGARDRMCTGFFHGNRDDPCRKGLVELTDDELNSLTAGRVTATGTHQSDAIVYIEDSRCELRFFPRWAGCPGAVARNFGAVRPTPAGPRP